MIKYKLFGVEVTMLSTAVVSSCSKFRYKLTRVWDKDLPRMGFIMLNPSTADASKDDPTIRKCIGFAARNGCGSIEVVNLFAYRATEPSQLKAHGWQVGESNDPHIVDTMTACFKVVVAWGANAREQPERVHRIIAMAENLSCELLTLHELYDGTPRHPLMLPYACVIGRWSRSPNILLR